ncbi:cation efflux family-domain-containing protein [Umbelopsis sp. AD052]|nr:cation efflux family-domain-containing protein [Umbelopsis sp. AD052]
MQPATRQFTKRHPVSPNPGDHALSGLHGQAIAIQTSAPLRAQPSVALDYEDHSHHDHHTQDSHDHHDHHQHDHDHSQFGHSLDHSGHDHYGHNHHTLDDSDHDHYHNHQNHEHDHNHNHNHHHGHHHDHDHDHSHSHSHGHHSHESYSSYAGKQQSHFHTPVNTAHYPLPSVSSVFSTLNPEQKSIFSVACLQAILGFMIYGAAGSLGSLSMLAYSYIVVFDAIGLINTFVSTVLEFDSAFRARNVQRPYGAIRLQILLALASAIYLLFFSMQVSKESLEHLLLPSSHDVSENSHTAHPEKSAGIITFLLLASSIGISYLAGVNLQNHETFCKVWRRMPITMQGISYSVINRGRRGAISTLRGNIFTSSVIGSGLLVVMANYIFRNSAMDKLVATAEAVAMFYVAGPTATALGKLILQTTPKPLRNGIEGKLRELQQIKGVLSIGRTHFWQNTFGQYIASLELHVAADVDEQEILQTAYHTLRGLIKVGGANDENMTEGGELNISVIKA